ncbi:MAG: hexose kinase [Chitinivibrionales bacterium]|nr:hexose kinase [Chitinivibrionales bacterium]
MIYCVLLNPSLDVCYSVGELRPGTTETDVPSEIHPAGKALNAAKVIRTLGEDVCVVGIMPRNNRTAFESYCRKHGIHTDFYAVDGSVRVNATVTESETGQTTHLSSRGPRYAVRIQDEFAAFVNERLREGDTWVFSGSLPHGFEGGVYATLIQECHHRGIRTYLDARGDALRMGVRAKPDTIKPNLGELEAFFEEHIEGIRHIALKGKRLLDMGVGRVFVSLGEDGMIALHENDCLLCSVPSVPAVDTVGCGDAVVAGVVVGTVRNFSFSETCRMAAACGVSNALHPGPGAVRLDEVWRIMEEVAIENA